MAEVYKAYHANLNRYVAIKVLHAFLADDEEFARRFGQEAQNIARLKHPHIVQVYDYEFDEGSESYYMVMELIEGETLKDRLFRAEQKHKRMDLEEALRITREAASALAYAHKAGMIHRDVKPANLMLDHNDNDRVVLTDFGIAKIVTGSQFTVTGGLVGTPAYMSPEQGVGETGDERSDLYSLGVILFQMVTGSLPYDAETPLALILKHMNDPIPSLQDFVPSLPPIIDQIIQKLMAKEPDERYATAETLIEDIRQAEETLFQNEDDTPVNLTAIDLKQQAKNVDDGIESPTIPFNNLGNKNPGNTTTQTLIPVSKKNSQQTANSRGMMWVLGLVFLIAILGGGYVVGASSGVFPALAFLASPTPTQTTEPTATSEPTFTATTEPTNTVEPTATDALPTDTPTATATTQPTDTPTLTPTDTVIPSDTPEPSETPLPSATPNATTTLSAQRTATFAACTFDYAIIDQTPEDGEDGGFFTINSDYTRTITLFNSGTCPWERNTSLTFVEGEDFNAGPRIFIREEVGVAEEVEVTFEGTLPSAGSVDPLLGYWQLRTPGQLPIGEPFAISIQVFDPGT